MNTEENYVWAVVDHFSIFAIMGLPKIPIWMQPWFLATIAVAVVAIAAVAILMRRKSSAVTITE